MVVCTKDEFQAFVGKVSNLCAGGMVSADYCRYFKLDFAVSRQELLTAYEAFISCCSWLDGCRYDEYATHFSPGTDRLLPRVSAASGCTIPLGALIAAVLYLELPYVIPGNSPGLAVGISRFCPRLHASRV